MFWPYNQALIKM